MQVIGRALCLLTAPGSSEGSQMVWRVQTSAGAMMPGLLHRTGIYSITPQVPGHRRQSLAVTPGSGEI